MSVIENQNEHVFTSQFYLFHKVDYHLPKHEPNK